MGAAVPSFIGLFIGAGLQFIFTTHLENKKHHREQRSTAYADYLKCVSELANLGHQRQSPDGRELASRTADAKCRISLYGAGAVIRVFADFERLGAATNTPEQREAFAKMVVEMRRDAIGKEVADASDVPGRRPRCEQSLEDASTARAAVRGHVCNAAAAD
jgi:hypothetical protein